MKIETKIYADIKGDQWINKPNSTVEVAGDKEAVEACIAYGSNSFTLYSIDIVTMPTGEELKGQPKNHTKCLIVKAAPLIRDDAIAHYTKWLADERARKAAGQTSSDIGPLVKSLRELSMEASDSYFICDSVNVPRPERFTEAKYFDHSGNLLLELPLQQPPAATAILVPPSPSP